MCMIKVRPEIEEEHVVPARVIRRDASRGHSRSGSHRSRSSIRGDRETTTIIETIKAPPPPPSAYSLNEARETHTTIIQNAHPSSAPPLSDMGSGAVGHWGERGSPRASVVSTRSRDVDYYVDSSASYAGRSPRSSYRYVDGAGPRGSSQRITEGARGSRKELEYSGSQRGGERYGYNNYHGARTGGVSYVNPRHSAISQRSARSARSGREKIMVVDEFGREKYY